ncbi:MAG: DUF445 family protein [Acidimicrobiales bacterium]
MTTFEQDEVRRSDLRRMKMFATGLLVVAVVFVVAQVVEEDRHWVRYIRATAEASDGQGARRRFAVTALFKHPLNLPIPHTAIIQKRKDQIGASLERFRERRFLTREVIDERLADADIGLPWQ